MAASFFQMQDLLIARLNEIFQGTIFIDPALPADIEEFQKRITGRSPVIYVYYGGYLTGSGAGSETSKIIQQRWIIILTIRNYLDKPSESSSIKEADRYTDALISGLLGWDFLEQSADIGHMPLQLINAPAPIISKGAILFPFAFQTAYPLSNKISH
jgi:hypothetical protein